MIEDPANKLGGRSPQEIFNSYVIARKNLLKVIMRSKSNRDPLAEWAEWLAAKVMDGDLASSPVQADYDMTLKVDGTRVQTKYLANPSPGQWNWRIITFPENSEALHIDLYALLVLLNLQPVRLLVFHRKEMARLYDMLNKRHAGRGERLNFTEGDYQNILKREDEFRGIVDVVMADEESKYQRGIRSGH